MRFLVTGAGGMIGANLTRHLSDEGHTVHALDHFKIGRADNLSNVRAKVHQGDILDFDYEAVGPVDGVFHQAAITDTTVMDRALMMAVNVQAFERLLDWARSTGCRRVVYASSAATYGKGEVPMRESAQPAPANVYGESKVEMEKAARRFREKNPDMSVVGLRYFNVYGPWEFHKGAAASMIFQLYKQIASGRAPRVFKWGDQFRDFVYVKDVVEANLRAFDYDGEGAFNVGTGLPTSFNKVISILNGQLGGEKPTDYFDNPYGFYQDQTQADTTLADRELGFRAAFTPEAGIADYAAFLKANAQAVL